MQDEFQYVIEIVNELYLFENEPVEKISSKMQNEQQKNIFLAGHKKLTPNQSRGEFLLLLNLIPMLIKKLDLLQNNNITQQELSLSLIEYIKNNTGFFETDEAIESILHILENFPNDTKESISLAKWVNQLDIENGRSVQIFCYLICSFNSRPFEALKLQLSIMPFLEKTFRGISPAVYNFILYPFARKYWSSRVIKEPSKFYFLDLWQKNLASSIDVPDEHKLVPIYALVCMHLSYIPKKEEQSWMQNYIDEVIDNN